ncbi:MAG: MBOAT family O-acyltransferase [Acidimicrobiales bacterium]|nr:MBOAT family O-acyltransferase [Acidimicrobiales bacterium]
MIDGRWILAVAVAVAIHWITPHRHRARVNLAVGVVLLTAASPVGAAALVGATTIAFLGTRGARASRTAIALVTIATAFVLAKLLAMDSAERDVATVATLLGFAYTAPRVAHVVIDVRSGRLRPPSLLALCSYLWYWPLLVIGPIHRFPDHEREFRRHRADPAVLAQGVERVVVGLFTAVVIANIVVSRWFGDWIDGIDPERAGLVSALRSVEYGANLYAAFAGWSAVAIGIANLQGIRVLPNFHRPFLQRNIADFWRGWHISLTRWATDYLYRPAMAQWRRHVPAITVTMVAIGLWHELTARYLIWGAYHAAGLAIHRAYADRRGPARAGLVSRGAATLLTVAFVMAGFTITRAASVDVMLDEFRDLFVGGW